MHKLASLAAVVLLLGCPSALGFDFARYQATDLDALMKARPRSGLTLYGAEPLKLRVTLVSYAEGCETESLKTSLAMAGVAMDLDAHPVTRCIKVRSKKGKDLRMFIQDVVSDFLPKEVPLGSPVTLFAIHVYTAPDGPGLLVNEFLTGAGNDPTKSGSTADQPASTAPPCGCGTADFHPGIDVTNDTAEAPVRAVDDGIVIKVEQDEEASVDALNIGRCGRYVVIKHSYPDGRTIFTRYAQLGRIVGSDGRPVAPGSRVTKAQQIGEVGSRLTMHFEVRPVDPNRMDKGAGWTARYGGDPTMDWSRYQAVDPVLFYSQYLRKNRAK